MDEVHSEDAGLGALIGEEVVVDVKGRYVYLGTLHGVARDSLVLHNADVHACEDSQSTNEFYVLEAKKNGVRANRRVVYLMRADVLSISRLQDVVDY
ncbi:MAG: hypothetical protein GXY85_02525 [Candidatus Brocadiaceae bacterium]|nr:hypothetical protein [Candidatus Brocadiaceae bacterium]